MMKSLVGICMCVCVLLLSTACADNTVSAGKLPLNFDGGTEPLKTGFKSDLFYEDPTISVNITTGREENCDYWIADIIVTDASQLRTVSAGGYNTSMAMSGTALAKRVNAVLAIDGDYYCYTGSGYIVRQGEVYLEQLRGDRDILLVDEIGNFHVRHLATMDDAVDTIRGRRVVNAFFFGPILVENGEAVQDLVGQDMAYKEKRQRMCICQVGPLHYKAICCAAPARGSAGMTLQQFADFVARQEVMTAYNLDGGDSTMMIFGGEKINDKRTLRTNYQYRIDVWFGG